MYNSKIFTPYPQRYGYYTTLLRCIEEIEINRNSEKIYEYAIIYYTQKDGGA